MIELIAQGFNVIKPVLVFVAAWLVVAAPVSLLLGRAVKGGE